MTPAQQIARLQEQLDDALYQIRLLKGEPQPFELMGKLGLSRTEARVVSVIMQRGRITRAAIYQVIYGDRHPDEAPEERSVVRVVSRARKRLREHDIEIENIWSTGYAMTPDNVAKLKAVMAAPATPVAAAQPRALDQLLHMPSPSMVPSLSEGGQ